MNIKTPVVIFLALIAFSVLAGIALYPSFPERVASHWNAEGDADDSMPKFWGVFLMPMILAGLFLVYLVIPRIDPIRGSIESFRSAYDTLWLVIASFFFYVFSLMLLWNLGYHFDFTLFIIPAIAGMFYGLGSLLPKTKRNWFVGIRTPWTLSSDAVWEKTHKLGGKLFKLAALFSLAGVFIRDSAFILVGIIVPALAVGLATVVYSYILYRKAGI